MIAFDTRAMREGMNDLQAGIVNAIKQALAIAVKEATEHARHTTLYKDRTGKLRQNTTGESFGYAGKIIANTPYATWVENGTLPHVISARKASALRFVMNGQTIFRRSVNHPGTAERPFMQQAADHGQQVLDYGAEYLVEEAIRRA